MPGCLRTSLSLAVLLLVGCQRAPDPEAAPSRAKSSPVVLRVAVYDDEQLARAIDRLQGEWLDRGQGAFETVRLDPQGDAESLCADADLVLFPSRWLGRLCEDHRLRPMRSSALEREELRFADFFPAVRDVEIVYGNRVMALPIGCPTPLRLQGAGSVEFPDDEIRLALSYLAWAAPHAVHRSRQATLFQAEGFRPRLADPPFVRALDAFAEAASGEGGSGEILVGPRRDHDLVPSDSEATVSRPPGAQASFNPIAKQWEPLEGSSQQATLLASSGRLLGVTSTSRNAAAAFRLAAWLAGPEQGPRLSTSGDSVANCRGSMARRPDAWVGSLPALASDFSERGAEALRSQRLLIAPRLPGADEYLTALGQQVARRLVDDADSAEALQAAAEAWTTISERLGIERQRRAYLRSINAADYTPQTR